MAPDPFDASSLRYKGRVPKECFLAKLPDWLQHCSDNVVSPSHDLAAEGNVKYIRASKHMEFCSACKAFARYRISGPAAGAQIQLKVVIMPYMPLIDAYQIHQLISEPDVLPDTFEDVAKSVNCGQKAQQDDKIYLGLGTLFDQPNAEENEEDEEEEVDYNAAAAKWEMKRGCLSIDECGGIMEFVVVNYSFLWSKAERYCTFRFIAYPLEDILGRLDTFDKLVHKPSPLLLHQFNDEVEKARKQLIFAMYMNDLDPHDIIRCFFPSIHDRVYLDCVLCKPDSNANDADDSPETMGRLFQELNGLGLQEFDATISVENAQYNLMRQEGFLEEFLLKSGTMRSFTRSEEQLRTTVQTLLQNLKLVTAVPTLIGASSMVSDEY
ncbi:hypothetical protein C2845_PM05G15890 [Panicum miliaceum]|uniref:Uncharacterized protein n=1 Tax=Panicum miliaceum TaxID=4540 RepID=A0A3L6T265_PANMI|nr:hypothetical protein C2845_PM05G15890 [Panicum miliaceum]